MTTHPDLALAAVEAWPALGKEVTAEWDVACSRSQAVSLALVVLNAAVRGGHVVTLQAHQDALEAAS